MSPTPADQMLATVNASPLLATYGTEIDRESAREILAAKMNAAAASKEEAKLKAQYEKEWKEASSAKAPAAKPKAKAAPKASSRKQSNPIEDVLGSRTGQTVVREVLRGIFSTLKKG
jgi:membrane protein involved in colicin uptake